MINIEQFTDFCNEQKLATEEATLCLAINYRQQNSAFATSFSRYYERNMKRFNYGRLIDRLVKMELLRNLNIEGEYKLDLLQVTDKFRSTLFVEIDSAFAEALKLYPKTMQIVEKGVAQVPISSRSNDDEDKAAYAKYVLKGSDRANHKRFMYIMGELQRDRTVFPGNHAKMKWITFCKNWDGTADVWETKPKTTIRRI